MKHALPALLTLPVILLAISSEPPPVWGSPQIQMPERFADPKGVWRDRPAGWGHAITEPAFAMEELAKRCIPRLLVNCETFKGGYLSAPGRPRIYWQIQDGDADEYAASAGFTLFVESNASLIPIFWAAEADTYEAPVVFWKGDGDGDGRDPIIAIAGFMQGTGNYNADALFRWTNGPHKPVASRGWQLLSVRRERESVFRRPRRCPCADVCDLSPSRNRKLTRISQRSEIEIEAATPRHCHEASLEEVMTEQMTAQAALDRLETLYTQSVTNLRDAVRDFVETGARPDPLKRAEGVFAYPELRIRWDGDRPQDLE